MGTTIHDMVVVKPGPFAHFWWYPNDSDWKTFKYHNHKNTKDNPKVQEIFGRVDQMRLNIHLAPKEMKDYHKEFIESLNGGKNMAKTKPILIIYNTK